MSDRWDRDLYYAVMSARIAGVSYSDFTAAVRRVWLESLDEEKANVSREKPHSSEGA